MITCLICGQETKDKDVTWVKAHLKEYPDHLKFQCGARKVKVIDE